MGSKPDRPLRVLAVAVAALWPLACSQAFWNDFAKGYAATQPGGSAAAASNGGRKLMLFGGQGHKTYLGCINCSDYASDSVFNKYGKFGSAYGESIFNKFGDFGSMYSMYSACNPYASDPPVIVDDAGNFYGRLTVNNYNGQVTRDETLRAWLAGVCGG